MPVHFEVSDDHIAVVTIDFPESRNALDMYGFRDLAACWHRCMEDDEIWAAIVTGVPGHFMSGANLKTFIPQVTELQAKIQSGEVTELDGCNLSDSTDAVLRGLRLNKPVIAAVDGPCVAGGMEMLCGTDIRVATPEATFGVMEPKRGLFAGGGTTVRLPRQIPYVHAMAFLLTAEAFPAEDALRMGLINEIVVPGALMDTAFEWARRIMANAPLAVWGTKESVLRGQRVTAKEAYDIESEIAGRIFMTEDAKEGPQAFAEKRAPEWKAR